MNNNMRNALAAIGFSSMIPCASGYPILDAVVGLPSPELITVYPDEADPNLYYFVPTRVALAIDPLTKKPRLGVQYWGLTGPDPSGKGAALTFSVVPAYDRETVNKVAEGLKKQNPNAKFAFPTLVDSSIEVVLNGHFFSRNQDTAKPTTKGGTVDAAQAFSIALTDIGARAFAQGVSPDSDILGAKYTYKFTGVAKRLHANVTVYHKRVYDHFKATATSSSWWGLVQTSWSTDWQKLLNDGAIKIDIIQGGETDKDAYMLEVFKSIVNAKIGETGMFAPKLQPGGADVTTGSAPFGWGFSGGAAWNHLEESVNYAFIINTQKLEDREFSTGLTFSAVCAKYPDSFVDLTAIGNQCIDKNLFQQYQKAEQTCAATKLKPYDELLAKELITPEQWVQKHDQIYSQSCYSYSPMIASGVETEKIQLPSIAAFKDRQTCTAKRLEQLQMKLDSGAITTDQWQAAQSMVLAVPCHEDKQKANIWFKGFLENQILHRSPQGQFIQ